MRRGLLSLSKGVENFVKEIHGKGTGKKSWTQQQPVWNWEAAKPWDTLSLLCRSPV